MNCHARPLHFAGIAFLFVVLACLYAGTVQARPPIRVKSPFKIGEKVKVEWGGESVKGEVTGIDGFSGWVTVRCTIHEHDMPVTLPPDRIHKIPKKTDKGALKKKADDSDTGESSAESNELRIWTDITGEHTINARFMEIKDGKVRLKKSDGKTVAIPLEKLSEDDQKLAKQLADGKSGDSPFVDDDSHSDSGRGASKRQPSDDDEDSDEEQIPKGRWGDAQPILIDASAEGEIVPDAAKGDKFNSKGPIALEFVPMASAYASHSQSVSALLLDRPHQRLILVHSSMNPSEEIGTRVECCNLKSGKTMGSVILKTAAIPVDLSPDGSSVVCLPARFHTMQRGAEPIEVWRLDNHGQLVKRWDIARKKDDHHALFSELEHAMFVSPNLVLAISHAGSVASLWNVEKTEAVYMLSLGMGGLPALSANRKQMAVMGQSGVAILDAATGETIAALPGEPEWNTTFAFHPDGTQLAGISGERLRIWDLKRKVVVNEVWLPKSLPHDNVQWVGGAYLLVGDSYLIDPLKLIVLWQYHAPSRVVIMPDDSLAFIETDMPMAATRSLATRSCLCFTRVPHSEATALAYGLSDDQLMAIKPGIQVSLDVRLATGTPEEVKQVTESLTARLEANGISVASGQPIVLEAVIEPGKTETQTYQGHVWGPGGGPHVETANVTSYVSRLTFKENGHVLWERQSQSGGAPMVVQKKEGQSIDAAIAEQRGSLAGFFFKATLPKYLARHGEKAALGASRITPNGPVPLTDQK
jgi:hypothetical protein